MSEVLVRDAMHRGVVSCDSSTTVIEATKLMMQSHVRSLIVVDADCGLVGILSQSDLVNAKLVHPSEKMWEHLSVGEIMTSRVLTVTPHAPVEEAARTMIDHRIHRIVVAEADDPCHPIGILSMGDIMRHMMNE